MAAAGACATTSQEPDADAAVRRAGYELEVVDGWGRQRPTHWHAGRAWVLGEMGERYAVRVRNQTGRRIEAVVTVDGRNVLDGQPGDFRTQRGYLVEAYGTVTIDGFRQSLDAVATFRFGHVEDSYAARMGDARNVGVIGVAVFPERTYARPYPIAPRPPYRPHHDDELGGPYSRSERGPSSAEPAPPRDKAASPSEESRSGKGRGGDAYAEPRRRERRGLGTVYGESRDSRVEEVPFERASSSPLVVLHLRYDDREGLLAMGIPVDRPRPHRPYEARVRESASPFPYTPGHFAPPPPGR